MVDLSDTDLQERIRRLEEQVLPSGDGSVEEFTTPDDGSAHSHKGDALEPESVKAESLDTIADEVIDGSRSDPQSVIENAGSDSIIWIKPGTTVNADNIQFAAGQRLNRRRLDRIAARRHRLHKRSPTTCRTPRVRHPWLV